RVHRRGLLVLPGPEVRDAPRRRALDRARGEADAQVPEPLLLDERLRAEALPQGRRRLREHPGQAQDHVRRLLPDGPQPRADLHRHEERPLQGRGLAEVPPRERGARLQALSRRELASCGEYEPPRGESGWRSRRSRSPSGGSECSTTPTGSAPGLTLAMLAAALLWFRRRRASWSPSPDGGEPIALGGSNRSLDDPLCS